MPGNRSIFEASMKRAAEHAWNQRWDLALADYQNAAKEFPDDMAARGNLALAYYRLGTWESALVHYTWMLERAPENAFIMDRLVEIYLKLERRADAKRVQARLDALNQRGRGGPKGTASSTGGLTTTSTGSLPAAEPAPPPPPAFGTRSFDPTRPSMPRPAPRTEGVLTSGLNAFELNEVVALAMAYEESGKVGEAIRHYEQAISAGLDRADAFYSLGLLYQQQGRHHDALAQFAHCLDDADYAMSATYATGISQRALGRLDEGARMLSLAISLIDHDQIGGTELDELIVIYRAAITALADVSNFLQASNLASALADFLASRGGHEALIAEYNNLSNQLQAKLTTSLNEATATSAAPAAPTPAPRSSIISRLPEPGRPTPPSAPVPPVAPPPVAPPSVAPPASWSVAPQPTREAAPMAGPSPAPVVTPPVAPATPWPTAPAIDPARAEPRRLTGGLGRAGGRRLPVLPVTDDEAPDRMASSYRRVTGSLGGEVRGGTGSLAGEARRGTGTLGGETRRGTGTLAGEARRGTEQLLSGQPTPGRMTTQFAERTTVLLGDRLFVPSTPQRLRRLHAPSGPLPGLAEQPEVVRAMIAEADANIAAGHLLGAIDACRAAIILEPRYVFTYLRLAELHALRGDLGTALEIAQMGARTLGCRGAKPADQLPFLRLIARLRPSDETALTAYTEAAYQAGQPAAAAPLIRRLVRRLLGRNATSRALTESERLAAACPDNRAAQVAHADTLTLLGQPEEALDLYRKVLSQAPDHLGAISGANLCFALLDQTDLWWSSLDTLTQATRADRHGATARLRLYRRLATSPAEARARTAAGLFLIARGQTLAAQEWLAPLASRGDLDPSLRAVVLHAASLIAAARQDVNAERDYRRAALDLLCQPAVAAILTPLNLFEHPLSVTVLALALAELLVGQNDLPGAIQVLDQICRTLPPDEAILNFLADLHLRGGRLGSALGALDELATHHRNAGRLDRMAAVLDRMSQLAPNNIAVKTKLIDAYLDRGFVEQARRELELRAQLQASAGKLAAAIASLQKASDICWMMGKHDDAFALCARMIELQPSNTQSRQYLITLYLQTGQIDRAVEQTWALAEMHIAENNHRDAIADLHQIIGLAPDDVKAHHRLGEALAAIGEYAQAERVYRRLVRQGPDDPVARAKQKAMALLAGDSATSAA